MEYRIIRKSSVDDDTLYHSDRFLGDEFSDDLYHWKYIKREKKNGKWRYYYDVKDALGYDERAAAGQAIYDYEEAEDAYVNSLNRSHDEYERLVDMRGGLDPYTGDTKLTEGDKEYLSELRDDIKNKDTKMYEAGKKASEAVAKYYKTPIGKLDRLDDHVDEARRKVSELLSKLSKKIKPDSESLIKYRK